MWNSGNISLKYKLRFLLGLSGSLLCTDSELIFPEQKFVYKARQKNIYSHLHLFAKIVLEIMAINFQRHLNK